MSTAFLVALIVTHNPDVTVLRRSVLSIADFVDKVVIVDNASSNRGSILDLCDTKNCEFLEVGFNSGIAHALKVGVNYAYAKYRPEWLLFLDDDSIVPKKTMAVLVEVLRRLPNSVGTLRIVPHTGDCRVYPDVYGWFSGTFIRADAALKACCRDDFFLDQADHDMYFEARRLGYRTIKINCKLLVHRLGVGTWVPFFSHRRRGLVAYEPPWRLYYIVRNSTVLLLEGKMDVFTYLNQLKGWAVKALFKEPIGAMKALGLGLIHGVTGRLGYVPREYFAQSNN